MKARRVRQPQSLIAAISNQPDYAQIREMLDDCRKVITDMFDFTILVVDDDDAVRDSLCALLCTAYNDVRDFSSGGAVLAHLSADIRGCMVIDIHMPGLSGLDVMDELTARSISIPTILMTGRRDSALWSRANKQGAVAVLEKPLDHVSLFAAIEAGRQQLDG
jgi:two-component system response regulator FixJ